MSRKSWKPGHSRRSPHPEDLEASRALVKALLSGEDKTRRMEKRYLHADGGIVWADVSVTLLRDRAGEPLHFITHVADITALREAREARQKSEEILNETGRMAKIGGWEHDLDTGRAVWTRSLYEIIEIDPGEEPPGVNEHLGYYPEKDQAVLKEAYERCAKTGEPFDLELQVRTALGKLRWCRATGEAERRDGKIALLRGTFQDITRQKRSEEALLKSEGRYRKIVTDAPVGIFQTTPEGQYLMVNPAFAAGLGYDSPEELMESVVDIALQYADPGDREEFKEKIAAGGSLKGDEIRMVRKDGATVWFASYSKAVRGPSGEVELYDGFALDVTERKRAEEALRESELRYRKMVTDAPMGIFRADRDLRYQMVNPAFAAILGYDSPEQMIEEAGPIPDYHPEPGVLEAALEEIHRIGALKGFEATRLKRDGSAVWLSFYVRIVPGPTKEDYTYEGFAVDITERKRAEESLKEARERYQALFERSFESIYLHDFEGNFIDANQAALDLLGYDRGSLENLSFADLLSEDQMTTALEALQEIIEFGVQKKKREYRLKARSGEDVFVETRGTVLYREGRPSAILATARDVTGERKAYEELKNSEERFRTLFESSPMAIGVTQSEDGRVVLVNDAMLGLTGYSREEMAGLAMGDTYADPEDRERIIRELAKGSTVHRQKTLLKRKDGGLYTGSITAAPFRYGSRDAVIATVLDVTEQERAQKALEKSEARLRSYLNAAPYGVFIVDENGRFLEANPEALRLTGYDLPEILSMAIPDMLAREDMEAGRQHFARVVAEGTSDGEILLRCKNGKNRCFSISATRLSPTRFMGYLSDVTDRKQMEEDLRQRENLLSRIFEILPVGLWFADGQGKLLQGNPAGVRIWGAEPRVGQEEYGVFKARRLPSGEELAPQDWALVRTIQEGVTISDELLEIEAFDGRKKVILNYTAPVLDPRGKVEGAVVVNLDVTERHSLEEQLRQAQKMESVGRLAGGVAHDFNNMLGVITGYAELALARIRPEDPLRDDLMEIRKAAARSTDLTRQLLAFARKQDAVPRVVDLNRTIEKSRNMMRRLLGEDIEVSHSLTPDLWRVHIDPSQMDQILANLLVNARDAIHGAGTISIGTENVALDEAYCSGHPDLSPGEYVLFSVSDTGSGMDRETRERIFEPFFTTKGEGKGTGLGLSTVFGIVRQNQGGINVYSEPGSGTTFRIYLPRHRGAAEEFRRESSDALPPGRETVLVVEDEEQILRLTMRILERAGYKVLACQTPGEALELCREFPEEIHLLITDVVMPEMNGKELADRIRERRTGLKVLYMSGYTADVIAHHGVLDEGLEFIQKPFSQGPLVRKVRTVLDGAS